MFERCQRNNFSFQMLTDSILGLELSEKFIDVFVIFIRSAAAFMHVVGNIGNKQNKMRLNEECSFTITVKENQIPFSFLYDVFQTNIGFFG